MYFLLFETHNCIVYHFFQTVPLNPDTLCINVCHGKTIIHVLITFTLQLFLISSVSELVITFIIEERVSCNHRRSWSIFWGGHFFSFLVEISWDRQPLEQIKCDTSLLLGMFQVNYWELCKISCWCPKLSTFHFSYMTGT